MSRVLSPEELANHLLKMKESYQNCSSELGGPIPINIVMTSGYFDPLGDHHIEYLRSATRYGNIWISVVNGNNAAIRKKKYVFLDERIRAEIVSSLRFVHFACIWDDGTQFVDGAIELLKPNIFAKGGDRSDLSNISEQEQRACRKVGCKIVLGVGGKTKTNSSSNILKDFINNYGHSV